MITKFETYNESFDLDDEEGEVEMIAVKCTDDTITNKDIYDICTKKSIEAAIETLKEYHGWVKIIADDTDDCFLYITDYKIENDELGLALNVWFDAYYMDGVIEDLTVHDTDNVDFYMDNDFIIIKGVEYEPKRVISKNDPYGEEIWEDTNESIATVRKRQNYPFVEMVDLTEIVPNYFSDNYEHLDIDGLNNRLKRIFKKNWVEFYYIADDSEMSVLEVGIINDVKATYWLDPTDDLEIIFIDGGCKKKLNIS